MVPPLPNGGVTTSVACVPLSLLKAPAVPPVTVMSLASKLTPTSSLNTKLKVTGPEAVGAETLLAIVTVGAVVSGAWLAGTVPTGGRGAPASPPPQPTSVAAVSSAAAGHRRGERFFMAFGLRRKFMHLFRC